MGIGYIIAIIILLVFILSECYDINKKIGELIDLLKNK